MRMENKQRKTLLLHLKPVNQRYSLSIALKTQIRVVLQSKER